LSRNRIAGFTLAELLIALVILGVIATFTIPKILSSQRDGRYNAAAKETIATISNAYTIHRNQKGATGWIPLTELTPYINYVSRDTTSIIDQSYSWGTIDCSTESCYKLHNGGMLAFWDGDGLDSSDSNYATWLFYDPDATTDGTTNGPGKSFCFVLYGNGRVSSYTAAFGVQSDPPWFSW
jgi:prepilin-type N-terminal cleavage/methylation domain-containing protein